MMLRTENCEPSRISVVIPAYNSETCISRAINSVLEQTFKAHEIIVIDDNSTDKTPAIIKQYGPILTFLQLKTNSGPSVARNMGIQTASGNWIAFLDADDEWLPDKLSIQNKLINEHRDLKWCSANYLLDDGIRWRPMVSSKKVARVSDGPGYFENYFRARVRRSCFIWTTTLMIKREIFNEVGFFDNSLIRHQDWDLWWRIAHHYPKIGYIAEPLAIRHLTVENPVSAQLRAESKRGELLRKIISVHLRLADQHGTLKNFKPYAFLRLRNSILMMLFLGYKYDARKTINQFKKLFKWYWRMGVYFLTIFPRMTSLLFRSGFYLAKITGIDSYASRRWNILKYKRSSFS